MTRTAIIAGMGALPGHLAAALAGQGADYLVAGMQGFPVEGLDPQEWFRFEQLVPFFDRLLDLEVTQVIFAGAIRRPRLDPALFDPRTAALVPRVLPALQAGDDALLRAVIALFEEAGLAVVGVARHRARSRAGGRGADGGPARQGG